MTGPLSHDAKAAGEQDRLKYEPPKLVVYGDIRLITQNSSGGTSQDNNRNKTT